MKRLFWEMLMITVLVGGVIGCGKEKVTVSVVGSTTVAAPAQTIADTFAQVEEDIQVDIQGIGSSAGVKAIHQKTADIGMASRELKTKEKEWGLTEHVVAYDGIAICVNPSNKVADLKMEQIQKIFKGEITNWKEIGGIDADILVISREAGSGTRGAFEEVLGLQKKNQEGKKVSAVKVDALIAEGNGAVKANINKKEQAIGYISLGYIDENVKALQVDSIKATTQNVKNSSYKVSRPLLMLTNGEMSEAAKSYLDYILSEEGQAIIAEKYIPVK